MSNDQIQTFSGPTIRVVVNEDNAKTVCVVRIPESLDLPPQKDLESNETDHSQK